MIPLCFFKVAYLKQKALNKIQYVKVSAKMYSYNALMKSKYIWLCDYEINLSKLGKSQSPYNNIKGQFSGQAKLVAFRQLH